VGLRGIDWGSFVQFLLFWLFFPLWLKTALLHLRRVTWSLWHLHWTFCLQWRGKGRQWYLYKYLWLITDNTFYFLENLARS
jgi:hypothetical protein